MDRKNVPVSSVRGLSEADGIVEAIVSVTNVVDSVNDVIEPGAYKNTLRKRNPKGVWSHDTNIPVAKTLKVEELMPGDERLPEDLRQQGAGALLVKMQFNLNTSRGRDAFHDVQFFAEEQEWSIGYSVPEGKSTTDEKTGVRFIKALELYEYSPVIFGAAPNTRTLSVKDDINEIESNEEEIYDEFDDFDEEKAGDYSDLNFSIPSGVKKQAEIGLKWSREYNRGGTSVGKNTANYLINNNTAAPRKVRHIAKYFPRHEVDLRTPANSRPGADGYPGAGLIAWKLWGGDAGRTWSTKLVEAMNRRDEMKALGIKAEPGDLKVGDFVIWNSSGGRARGKITRIMRRGRMRIPDSSFTVTATPEDPAAMIRVYREEGNQWVPTDTMVGHKFSTLTKIQDPTKDLYTDMPEGAPGSFGTPQRPGVVGRQPRRRRRRTEEGKPYRISRNMQGCSGYAVVKEGENSPVPGGCHETLAEARRHMSALYAAEAPKSEDADIESKAQDHGRMHPNLTADEQALHDALVRIADEHGKFDEDGSGIWAGYESPAENDEKSIGVKCANCTLYQGDGVCAIIKQRVNENGKCRFAVIPDGVVQWNDMKSYAAAIDEWEQSDEGIDWDAIEAKADGGPIRSHSTAVRDDTPINRSAILAVRSPETPDYYRKIFAYQLPKTDGTRKTHYTFIHHHISEDGRPGAAAMSELRVQMSVLNGARGGTVLRGADRKAVYNHLARHYRDGGTTPPSLKSDEELDNLMIKAGYIKEPLTKADTDE
jgi:HK97 family phage prohead protease